MKLTNGPLAGKTVPAFHANSGTLDIVLHGQAGRYSNGGAWVPTPGPAQARVLGYPVAVEPSFKLAAQ